MLILPDRALRRSLHLCPRLKLAYVNNPKVACSSIKLALQRAELQEPDYLPTSVHDHSASPLRTWPDVRGAGDLAGYFTFSFVRHPFSRLRSAYLNKIVTGQKQGRPREMAGFARDYCPSFEEFVLAICDQDPMHHNPHWRGQALGLSMGLIRYDFIGRLEEFTSGWRQLATRFDLPDPAPRAGRSTRPDQAGLEFNSAMKSAVMGCYHDDFHEFGYKGADFI
jgi:hypothetical protein